MTFPSDDSSSTFVYLRSLAQRAHGQAAEHLLPISLSAAVPLWVHGIYQRGGPLPEDWLHLSQIGHQLAEHGDLLFSGSSRPGETAELFNQLAEALAILSFLPAGVSFGSLHFEAERILSQLHGSDRAQHYLAQIRRQTGEERV
jgi:hypothetical protein